jgi:hypothetical protein
VIGPCPQLAEKIAQLVAGQRSRTLGLRLGLDRLNIANRVRAKHTRHHGKRVAAQGNTYAKALEHKEYHAG